MPTLTPGVTINSGEVVTRQTIYDLVALAGISGNVASSDLAADVITVTTQSLPPSNPTPGLVWFDQTEQLLKVWTDVLEGTGVSCWLACGPDAFDVALYATEPIPYGAAVVVAPNLGIRAVGLPTNPGDMGDATDFSLIGRFINLQFMAINQSADPLLGPLNPCTAPSGSWFAGRVYGIASVWAPGSRGTPPSDLSLEANYLTVFLSGSSGLTNPSGVSELRGAVAGATTWASGTYCGGTWGLSLRKGAPRTAAEPSAHYVTVNLTGPRFKMDK